MARNFTRLNGSNKYFTTASAIPIGGETQFEIEFEALFIESSSEQWLFSQWVDSGSEDRVIAFRVTGNKLHVYTSPNGESSEQIFDTPISSQSGKLIKIRFRWNNGNAKMYINEAPPLNVNTAYTTLYASSVANGLGYKTDSSNYLNGFIANVKVWTGGTRATGNLIYSYALDDTWSGTTSAVGVGVATTAGNITSADSESFDFNESTSPEQWENSGASVTLPLGYEYFESFAVIALMGQSNMRGAAPIVVGADDDYSAIGSTKQWGFDNQYLSAARNSLDHADNTTDTSGLWLQFVRDVVSADLFGKTILLVPCAFGGTSFSTDDWNPGDALYEEALVSLREAMETNAANTFEAVLWHQGETDADNSSSTHLADLTAMHADMVSRLSFFTADTPFILGGIRGGGDQPERDAINSDMLSFSQAINNGAFVDTSDLTLFDAYHFDSPSLDTMGARYAAELLAINGVTADTDPPVVTDAEVLNVTSTELTVSAESNEDGSASVLVLAFGSGQPADSAFDASTDTAALTGAVSFSISVSGLAAGQTHTVWLRVSDSAGNYTYNSINAYTLRAGHSGVFLTSVHPDTAERLESSPDLVPGALVEWNDPDVVIDPDATFDAAVGVQSFAYRIIDVEAGDISDEATQNISGSVDTTPSAFSFSAVTGAALSTVVTSASMTVAGVDAGEDIPVTITGGQYQVSTDNGSTYGALTSAATNVQLGYMIRVALTSSASNSAQSSATLTVGGVSATFNVTTLAATGGSPTVVSVNGGSNISAGATFNIATSDISTTNIDQVVFRSGSTEYEAVINSRSTDVVNVTAPTYLPNGSYTVVLRELP